jgi:hypothetical protein
MTTKIINNKPSMWKMTEDDDGHRDYEVEFKVQGDVSDGPFAVRNTPGLPVPGAFWSFEGDVDPFAHCARKCAINPVQKDGEGTILWKCGFTYTTKPYKRCQDFRFEDPLSEPMKLSGSWTKYKEEASENRFGVALRNSAHERLKGPKLEFDAGLPTVKVEQNVVNLELPLLAQLLHNLNSDVMWGLPPRCVKFSGCSWSQEFYGSCYRYYKRSLEFEVNPDSFDRYVADEGTKVLYGRWQKPGVWRLLCINGDVPDPNNPAHFIDFTTPKGNPTHAVLNGHGLPAGVCVIWDECAGNDVHGKRLGCPDLTGTGIGNVNTLTTSGSYTDYYVSAWNNVKGVGVDDTDIWINVLMSITPSAWVEFRIYDRGSLVTHGGKTWVAWNASRGAAPGVGAGGSLLRWLQLPSGLTNKGTFDWCTNYRLGDYVKQSATSGVQTVTGTGTRDYSTCDKTQQGKIKIEKYHDNNLFLLGIPAVF